MPSPRVHTRTHLPASAVTVLLTVAALYPGFTGLGTLVIFLSVIYGLMGSGPFWFVGAFVLLLLTLVTWKIPSFLEKSNFPRGRMAGGVLITATILGIIQAPLFEVWGVGFRPSLWGYAYILVVIATVVLLWTRGFTEHGTRNRVGATALVLSPSLCFLFLWSAL